MYPDEQYPRSIMITEFIDTHQAESYWHNVNS
jgi:hypothetical protein